MFTITVSIYLIILQCRFVHRLDYATSGVMCLALSKSAAKHAGKALEKRQVEKFYLALV